MDATSPPKRKTRGNAYSSKIKHTKYSNDSLTVKQGENTGMDCSQKEKTAIKGDNADSLTVDLGNAEPLSYLFCGDTIKDKDIDSRVCTSNSDEVLNGVTLPLPPTEGIFSPSENQSKLHNLTAVINVGSSTFEGSFNNLEQENGATSSEPDHMHKLLTMPSSPPVLIDEGLHGIDDHSVLSLPFMVVEITSDILKEQNAPQNLENDSHIYNIQENYNSPQSAVFDRVREQSQLNKVELGCMKLNYDDLRKENTPTYNRGCDSGVKDKKHLPLMSGSKGVAECKGPSSNSEKYRSSALYSIHENYPEDDNVPSLPLEYVHTKSMKCHKSKVVSTDSKGDDVCHEDFRFCSPKPPADGEDVNKNVIKSFLSKGKGQHKKLLNAVIKNSDNKTSQKKRKHSSAQDAMSGVKGNNTITVEDNIQSLEVQRKSETSDPSANQPKNEMYLIDGKGDSDKYIVLERKHSFKESCDNINGKGHDNINGKEQQEDALKKLNKCRAKREGLPNCEGESDKTSLSLEEDSKLEKRDYYVDKGSGNSSYKGSWVKDAIKNLKEALRSEKESNRTFKCHMDMLLKARNQEIEHLKQADRKEQQRTSEIEKKQSEDLTIQVASLEQELIQNRRHNKALRNELRNWKTNHIQLQRELNLHVQDGDCINFSAPDEMSGDNFSKELMAIRNLRISIQHERENTNRLRTDLVYQKSRCKELEEVIDMWKEKTEELQGKIKLDERLRKRMISEHSRKCEELIEDAKEKQNALEKTLERLKNGRTLLWGELGLTVLPRKSEDFSPELDCIRLLKGRLNCEVEKCKEMEKCFLLEKERRQIAEQIKEKENFHRETQTVDFCYCNCVQEVERLTNELQSTARALAHLKDELEVKEKERENFLSYLKMAIGNSVAELDKSISECTLVYDEFVDIYKDKAKRLQDILERQIV